MIKEQVRTRERAREIDRDDKWKWEELKEQERMIERASKNKRRKIDRDNKKKRTIEWDNKRTLGRNKDRKSKIVHQKSLREW